MLARRKGFTLIELLVVIAIIGILAAMLFPVFARARESARKTQCLSNIKNIAMAIQMYVGDYDIFWPQGKHDAQAMAYINENCGGCGYDCRTTEMNPYLRVPVILDEYIKNRDVWRCPSARTSIVGTAGVPILHPIPNWWTAFRNAQNGPCPRIQICKGGPFPPGWGGDVTDTPKQGRCGTQGAFDQSIGTPCPLRELKMTAMRDVSRTVVCLDAGVNGEFGRTSAYAYPDMTRYDQLLTSCGGGGNGGCWSSGDCGNPSVASQCSPLSLCYGGDGRWTKDVSYRKSFARHLGGENVGFADGHAKWMDAELILNGGVDHSRHGIHPQQIYGICNCFNPTAILRSDWMAEHGDAWAADPNGGLY